MDSKFSHNIDQGDRLADMLGCGNEWLTLDDLCGRAADRIEELEAEVKRLKYNDKMCIKVWERDG